METRHTPQQCKWSAPTIQLEWPLWLNAWEWQWSCRVHGEYTPLRDTRCCNHCHRWELRTIADHNQQ